MSAMASQITGVSIVCSVVYSGADLGKHQGTASLAIVRVTHRSPVDSAHKRPVTRKCFRLMTSSWSHPVGYVAMHITIVLAGTDTSLGIVTIRRKLRGILIISTRWSVGLRPSTTQRFPGKYETLLKKRVCSSSLYIYVVRSMRKQLCKPSITIICLRLTYTCLSLKHNNIYKPIRHCDTCISWDRQTTKKEISKETEN